MSFIHIKSTQFPIMADEEKELVNEGTYGKALAQYLQNKLIELGYNSPFICCEDWGWWVELKSYPFTFGVCIYSKTNEDSDPVEFVCTDGALGKKVWSWKKFKFIETETAVNKLTQDLMQTFRIDNDIELIGIYEEFPF